MVVVDELVLAVEVVVVGEVVVLVEPATDDGKAGVLVNDGE